MPLPGGLGGELVLLRGSWRCRAEDWSLLPPVLHGLWMRGMVPRNLRGVSACFSSSTYTAGFLKVTVLGSLEMPVAALEGLWGAGGVPEGAGAVVGRRQPWSPWR